MKTNKKTTKKTNAKTVKAAKPKAAKAEPKSATRCALCDAEIKGTGNNAAPLAEGVCCDKCNEKVVAARVKQAEYEAACREAAKTEADKLAKRRMKAREYYAANRAKLIEASKRSHAKRNASLRNQAAVLARVYDALCGVVSEHGAEFFDAFYKTGGAAMMNDIENALNG